MRPSRVENRRFELLADPELPKVLENGVVRGCTFFACNFGQTAMTPAERRLVKNVKVINCKTTNGSGIGPAIIEDVDVDGLETSGPFFARGAAYKHVKFRGRCGTFVLSSLSEPVYSAEHVRRFDKANETFYKDVDWALDISEGEFRSISINNVPADLVRRDAHTQVIVRRPKVERFKAEWSALDLGGTPWPAMLENILDWGLKDTVLVAPKRGKDFRRWLDGLNLLRKLGVADPD